MSYPEQDLTIHINEHTENPNENCEYCQMKFEKEQAEFDTERTKRMLDFLFK